MVKHLRRLMPTREALQHNRWLRWLGPALFHPRLWHMSRRGIAIGAAIGVFFAFIVPVAQFPLSAAAAIALRANVPSALAATLVNTPLTFGPVYYGAWRTGVALLGQDKATAKPLRLPTEVQAADPNDTRNRWQRSWDGLRSVGRPLLLGMAVFAVGFGIATYLLVNGIWHLHVRLKRRARLRKRGAGSAP